MNILILGGTIFIGLAVTKKLVKKGHSVSVFHRGKHNDGIPEEVNRIIGDKKNLTHFKDEFKKIKPDVILDMVPFSDVTSKRIVETMKDVSNRIIAISSCDVYKAYGILNGTEEEDSTLKKALINEKSPLRTNYYPYKDRENLSHLKDYDKILAENIYIENPEIDETILRLPMVFGENDYQHRLLPYLKQINEGSETIELEDNFANWKTCRGYSEDVANAICLTITNDKSKHQIYNVADPNNYSEKVWLKKIIERTNWEGRIKIKKDEEEDNFQQHLMIDSTKIRTELGYKESLPIEKQIKNTIQWEKSFSKLNNINLG